MSTNSKSSNPSVIEGCRRNHGSAVIHQLLAGSSHCPQRSCLVHVLRRRNRGAGYRQIGRVVRPRRHDFQLRGPFRVHGKLRDVRAWRCLCGRSRQYGAVCCPLICLGSRLRLHIDGTDQFGQRGAVPGPVGGRAFWIRARQRPRESQPVCCCIRRRSDDLLLAQQHQGHRRIQFGCAAGLCRSRPSWS